MDVKVDPNQSGVRLPLLQAIGNRSRVAEAERPVRSSFLRRLAKGLRIERGGKRAPCG